MGSYLKTLAILLVLAGCASSSPRLTPATKPPLDSRLAEPCAAVKKPLADDYDAWLVWALDLVNQYGDCSARHAETVSAWPK